MSAIKSWSLWCDHPECSDAGSFQAGRDNSTLCELRAAARLEGWEMVNAHDFCPVHAAVVRPATRRPTGQCTKCPARRGLRRDGTLRAHRVVTPKGRALAHYCDGSNWPPRKA